VAALRFGLVGAGRMGRNHLHALADSTTARVTAIVEPSDAARAALPKVDATIHRDIDSMLDEHAVDAALVCAPSDMHLATVSKLLGAGLPVLCEKPVGVTSAEAREAAALAAMSGLPFQVGFWRRFVPMLKQLRGEIESGAMGGIYSVICYQWDGEPPGAYFRTHSGGIFVDMGVHEFDQARWLTGQEIGEITSVASGVSGERWEGDPESAHAMAELSGGTTAVISLGRRFPLGDVCKVEVYGTKGAQECKFLWPPTADETFFGALRAQAESFARHVHGQPLEGAGGVDAAAALAAAERAASRVVNV
jgi:myo-inositol 2-dehydrogenase / D-chiro-inositol 1-dehydrogenase